MADDNDIPTPDDIIAAGLDAAREAVAALFDGAHRLMSDGHYSYFVPDKADALAAIDALRGES
jgi:hypothetical protein